MALVEAARAGSPASEKPEARSSAGIFQDHPVPTLAAFMLVLPAFASNFVLVEIFGWAMISA